MAQQETEEQTSSDQPSSEGDATTGRHRAAEEETTEQSAPAEGKTEQPSDASEAKTEKSTPAEAKTESAPAEAKTEKSAPEARTEKAAPADAPTEKQSAPPRGQQRGAADTSWAEPETAPRRHVDIGEIAWRAGNVIATVLRTLAILFALVLVANLVLVLVGVNPANGVAQFIGGLAALVILGFRDLFIPADPTIALIVNSLVAAVFWVFVGELASRLVRFVAARVK
ncbi:hypothetical protein [Actinomycetospora chiangmaiensis]|uniref:hypothetical protein n=1 Tax=Actinomycetospora chiangmaiensis TaxID=402650 RepID=UPI00035DBE08|nr:hypothetical protein [Actinomycetospora chiangmaiensis]